MNYTQADYDSPFGILVSVWGPIQWQFMHMISFNYPVHPSEAEKKYYYDYINTLQHVLPCRSCRENIIHNLKTANFSIAVMKNRDTFSRFVYKLHNIVNVMLGRKVYLTYEQVRDRYSLFRASCSVETTIENGCVIPLNNIKSRCIINIVPQSRVRESFVIDKQCLPRKVSRKSSKKTSRKNSKKH